MKKQCFILFMCFLLLAACNNASPKEEIIINLQEKGAEVPSSMYGLFFEEINHAGDGGLYAELIQNRGFEEQVTPSGTVLRNGRAYAPATPSYYSLKVNNWFVNWNIEEKKFTAWSVVGDKCSVAKDVLIPDAPLHKNTPNAFRLTIKNIENGGKAALVNSGYWGVPVKENEKYDLRFYLRTSDYNGTVKASIFDPTTGKEVAAQTLNVDNNGKWTEYKAELTSSKTADQCDFRLEFTANGSVFVDYVSLFPRNTFQGRPNGLRKELAEMLIGLKPAFMRWPGGCIVEGATLENRVKWQETIGDPMTRRGEWSLWGYRSTWGLGYHEFLQFCEDAGMDGMFVANVGMSCSIRNGDYVSGNSVEPYLQDIRDAIEYALGDKTTEWGAKRAENGHPAPFPLKYVELGNENGSLRYVNNFNYIYDKLKKEYPQLTFINTLTWWFDELKEVEKTDMIDPHWYENPAYFFNNSNLFAEAPRGKYDIYVGEYACNNGVGRGTMEAALSEAAFIFGMERNSDIVKMASYAPLISNDNQPNWSCNLIWIKGNNVMGRASYYVQKMFAENRPDYNVFIDKTTTEAKSKTIDAGATGVGSWNTQVEYKDIKITSGGKTITPDIEKFSAQKGEWKISDGVLSQISRQTATQRIFKEFSGDNYTLELKARKNGGAEGFSIYYGMTEDGQKGYVFNIGGWGNTATAVERITGSSNSGTVGRSVRHTIETGRWYDLKIIVTPYKSELYIDGKPIVAGEAQTYPLQFFISGYDANTNELIIKAVNAENIPYKTTFRLKGAQNVERKGKVITLKATGLDDENSFEEPEKIYPQESEYKQFGKVFNYEFPPFSYTVLRVKVDK
jgi:alpha-L-arabinofuranosidase